MAGMTISNAEVYASRLLQPSNDASVKDAILGEIEQAIDAIVAGPDAPRYVAILAPAFLQILRTEASEFDAETREFVCTPVTR